MTERHTIITPELRAQQRDAFCILRAKIREYEERLRRAENRLEDVSLWMEQADGEWLAEQVSS